MSHGRAGDVLVFRTNSASLQVDPADGGRIVSLRVHGHELLGASEPTPGLPPEFFSGSFLMAPWAGRTAEGRFNFEGAEYKVPANFGEHAMHGLAFDRAWEKDGNGIVLDLDRRWPFGGTLRQEFALTESSLTVTASAANDQRTMPVILGFHPWFRERLDDGSIASYVFEPQTRFVCDETGIPVSTMAGGGDRPWDDSFTDVQRDPLIRWSNGLEVKIKSSGSHWIVCETFPNAFCIEPLTGPVNGLAAGGAALAAPGLPVRLEMTLHWNSLKNLNHSSDSSGRTGMTGHLPLSQAKRPTSGGSSQS